MNDQQNRMEESSVMKSRSSGQPPLFPSSLSTTPSATPPQARPLKSILKKKPTASESSNEPPKQEERFQETLSERQPERVQERSQERLPERSQERLPERSQEIPQRYDRSQGPDKLHLPGMSTYMDVEDEEKFLYGDEAGTRHSRSSRDRNTSSDRRNSNDPSGMWMHPSDRGMPHRTQMQAQNQSYGEKVQGVLGMNTQGGITALSDESMSTIQAALASLKQTSVAQPRHPQEIQSRPPVDVLSALPRISSDLLSGIGKLPTSLFSPTGNLASDRTPSDLLSSLGRQGSDLLSSLSRPSISEQRSQSGRSSIDVPRSTSQNIDFMNRLSKPEPDPPEEPKKDETTNTIQNILQSIGFDFGMSKRMQELAKEKQDRENKTKEKDICINQTASFLGGGLSDEDLTAGLFKRKESTVRPKVETSDKKKSDEHSDRRGSGQKIESFISSERSSVISESLPLPTPGTYPPHPVGADPYAQYLAPPNMNYPPPSLPQPGCPVYPPPFYGGDVPPANMPFENPNIMGFTGRHPDDDFLYNERLRSRSRSASRDMGNRRISRERSPGRRDSRDSSPGRRDSFEKSSRIRDSFERNAGRRDSFERSPRRRDSFERSPRRRDSFERSPRRKDSFERSPRRRSSVDRGQKRRSSRSPRRKNSRERSPRRRSSKSPRRRGSSQEKSSSSRKRSPRRNSRSPKRNSRSPKRNSRRDSSRDRRSSRERSVREGSAREITLTSRLDNSRSSHRNGSVTKDQWDKAKLMDTRESSSKLDDRLNEPKIPEDFKIQIGANPDSRRVLTTSKIVEEFREQSPEPARIVLMPKIDHIRKITVAPIVKPEEPPPPAEIPPHIKARLKQDHEERQKKLEILEKEMDKLRKQQNEIMRKRQRQKDGHKDPLLTANSKLQEEIAEQIKALRKASEEPVDLSKFENEEDSKQEPQKQESPKSSVRYKFKDPGQHWCRCCNMVMNYAVEYCKHLKSKTHLQKADPYDRPWHLHSMTKKQESTKGPVQNLPMTGTEFMMSVDAFYCSLCNEYMGDVTSAEAHLNEHSHFLKYKAYLKKNPFYEKRYMLEKKAKLAMIKEEKDKAHKKEMESRKKLNKEKDAKIREREKKWDKPVADLSDDRKTPVTPKSEMSDIKLKLAQAREEVQLRLAQKKREDEQKLKEEEEVKNKGLFKWKKDGKALVNKPATLGQEDDEPVPEEPPVPTKKLFLPDASESHFPIPGESKKPKISVKANYRNNKNEKKEVIAKEEKEDKRTIIPTVIGRKTRSSGKNTVLPSWTPATRKIPGQKDVRKMPPQPQSQQQSKSEAENPVPLDLFLSVGNETNKKALPVVPDVSLQTIPLPPSTEKLVSSVKTEEDAKERPVITVKTEEESKKAEQDSLEKSVVNIQTQQDTKDAPVITVKTEQEMKEEQEDFKILGIDPASTTPLVTPKPPPPVSQNLHLPSSKEALQNMSAATAEKMYGIYFENKDSDNVTSSVPTKPVNSQEVASNVVPCETTDDKMEVDVASQNVSGVAEGATAPLTETPKEKDSPVITDTTSKTTETVAVLDSSDAKTDKQVSEKLEVAVAEPMECSPVDQAPSTLPLDTLVPETKTLETVEPAESTNIVDCGPVKSVPVKSVSEKSVPVKSVSEKSVPVKSVPEKTSTSQDSGAKENDSPESQISSFSTKQDTKTPEETEPKMESEVKETIIVAESSKQECLVSTENEKSEPLKDAVELPAQDLVQDHRITISINEDHENPEENVDGQNDLDGFTVIDTAEIDDHNTVPALKEMDLRRNSAEQNSSDSNQAIPCLDDMNVIDCADPGQDSNENQPIPALEEMTVIDCADQEHNSNDQKDLTIVNIAENPLMGAEEDNGNNGPDLISSLAGVMEPKTAQEEDDSSNSTIIMENIPGEVADVSTLNEVAINESISVSGGGGEIVALTVSMIENFSEESDSNKCFDPCLADSIADETVSLDDGITVLEASASDTIEPEDSNICPDEFQGISLEMPVDGEELDISDGESLGSSIEMGSDFEVVDECDEDQEGNDS
ncbi:E3 ubiquitin-protein ligase RBBP6 isoform X2 [Patella vulgata]|nr:E3 ubiquitin-protein ligase RBBP6 isoform X2 [Patella vulgata]